MNNPPGSCPEYVVLNNESVECDKPTLHVGKCKGYVEAITTEGKVIVVTLSWRRKKAKKRKD